MTCRDYTICPAVTTSWQTPTHMCAHMPCVHTCICVLILCMSLSYTWIFCSALGPRCQWVTEVREWENFVLSCLPCTQYTAFKADVSGVSAQFTIIPPLLCTIPSHLPPYRQPVFYYEAPTYSTNLDNRPMMDQPDSCLQKFVIGIEES